MKFIVICSILMSCAMLYAAPIDDATFWAVMDIADVEGVPRSVAAQQLMEETGDKDSGSRGDFSRKSMYPEDAEGFYSESGFQLYTNPKNLNRLLDRFWKGRGDTEKFDVYNYVHNTKLAMRYMRWLHDEFGTWYLAAAYYNCGPPRWDHKAKRYIPKVIPERTRRYARRIVNARAP